MAFNFSKIELAAPSAQRNHAKSPHAKPDQAASALADAGKLSFATPQIMPMR
jgi:hypothetical protein